MQRTLRTHNSNTLMNLLIAYSVSRGTLSSYLVAIACLIACLLSRGTPGSYLVTIACLIAYSVSIGTL